MTVWATVIILAIYCVAGGQTTTYYSHTTSTTNEESTHMCRRSNNKKTTRTHQILVTANKIRIAYKSPGLTDIYEQAISVETSVARRAEGAGGRASERAVGHRKR